MTEAQQRDFDEVLKMVAMIANPTPSANPGLLHYGFVEYLREIHSYCCDMPSDYGPGGTLRSRQVIGLALATWRRMNPSERVYGE